jgi:protocatechuate 3,4-dioxygenase beta subunit
MNRFFAKLIVLTLSLSGLFTFSSPAQAVATNYTLAGLVQDGSSSPISGGYKVSLYGDAGLFTSESATDGTYSISAPAGSYSLDVTYDDATSFPGFSFDRRQLVFSGDLLSYNLGVQIWDIGTGNISGTAADISGSVTAKVSISSSTVHFTHFAASDGSYGFENLPDGIYTISFTADGHYPQTSVVTISNGSSETFNPILQINESNTLSGQVLSTTGAALENFTNASVNACYSNWCAWATVNSLGEYYISNLPAGKVNLSVYPGQNAKYYSQQASVTIVSGANHKNFALEKFPTGPRQISGRVLSSNVAVANATVYLYSSDGKQNYSTQTDSEGKFVFSSLVSGRYSLNTYKSGFRNISNSYRSVKLSDTDDVVVDLGLAGQSSGVLSGTLVSSSDSAITVQGSISACLQSTGECSWASTNSQGSFVMRNVPSGNLVVRLYPADLSIFQMSTGSFNMSELTMNHDFSVTVVPPGSAAISGILKDAATDLPISNALINLSIYGARSENGPIQQVSFTTQDDGSYHFENLVAGRASFSITPRSGSAYNNSYFEVPLAEGQLKQLNPVLQTSDNTLTLNVCANSCSDANHELTNMPINATAYGHKYEHGPLEQIWFGQVTTDSNSVATFTGLPEVKPGDLRLTYGSTNVTSGHFLSLSDQGQSGSGNEGIAFDSAVTNGQNSGTLDLPVIKRTGTKSLSFQFRGLDGSLIINSALSVEIDRSISGLKTEFYTETDPITTNSGGEVFLDDLLSGDVVNIQGVDDFNINCGVNVKANQQSRTIVCQQFPQDQGQSSFTGAGSVSGSLVDQNGTSIQSQNWDFSVEVCNLTSYECIGAQANPQGDFNVGGLTAGTYSIRGLSNTFTYVSGISQEFTVTDSDGSVQGLSVSITKLPEGHGNSISGSIFDKRLNIPVSSVSLNVQPLALDGIDISSLDENLTQSVQMDDSGTFKVENLAPGTYDLSFNWYGDGQDYNGKLGRLIYGTHDDLVVRVAAGEQVSLPEIQWDSLQTEVENTLLVKLIDRQTRLALTIPDTACSIFGPNDFIQGTVDGSGSFTFHNLVVGATYSVNCSSTSSHTTSGAMIEPVLTGRTFVAQVGTNTLTLPSNVIKLNGKISGRVVDENGSPVSGVQVGASHGWDTCTSDSFGCEGDAYGDWDMTDSDGYYYLENLPEISVGLFFSDPRYSYIYENLDMSVNRVVTKNVTLYPIKNLSGTILDINGLPVGASQQIELVRADDSNQWATMQANSDSKGKYQFNGVGFGDYYVRFIRPAGATVNQSGLSGYLTAEGSISSKATEGLIVHINGDSPSNTEIIGATVSQGATIEGSIKVVDGSGNRVSAHNSSLVARIYVKDGNSWSFLRSMDQWLSTVGGQSKYRFSGLVPGAYKVRFSDVPWNGDGLQTVYNSGASSLDAAPEILITDSSNHSDVNALLTTAKPTATPPTLILNFDNFPVEQLLALEGSISATITGSTIQVQAPADQAGQWVSVGYADDSAGAAHVASRIGVASADQTDWIQLDANGVATISAAKFQGNSTRKLALISSQNQLLGWTTLAAKPHFTLTPIPTITGLFKLGQTLSAVPGNWDAGSSLTYIWKRNGAEIPGAYSSTYTLGITDIGAVISVSISGTKPGVESAVQTSSTTPNITAPPQTPVSSSISGKALKGKKLALTSAGWLAYPTPTIKYQWYRCSIAVKASLIALPKSAKCKAIAKATKTSYSVTNADRKKYLSAVVKASNSAGQGVLVFKSTTKVK